MKCIDPHHECGRLYYDAEASVSAFEDTQQLDGNPPSIYYAWRGGPEAHDGAAKTAPHRTMEGALAALERGECGPTYETADVEPAERPAHVWHGGRQVAVPGGESRPSQ